MMTENDFEEIYRLRRKTDYTAKQRIEKFSQMCNLTFERELDINNYLEKNDVDYDKDLQVLDNEFVESLVQSLKADLCSTYRSFLQTPTIGYEKKEKIIIIDGKHRFEAYRRYLEICEIIPEVYLKLSFCFRANIKIAEKLTLISLAEDEIMDNRKTLTKIEIMKNARVILTKCPEILGLKQFPKNSHTDYENKKECVTAVIDFFHVYPASLVLSNIWKVARISDKHAEEIFKLFEKIPSGFTVHNYDTLFNKYAVAPERVLSLLRTLGTEELNHKDFLEKLKSIERELIPLLNDYKAYDDYYSKREIIKFISTKTLIHEPKAEDILVKYVSVKSKNLSRCGTTEKKLDFLRNNFEKWYKEYNEIQMLQEESIDSEEEPLVQKTRKSVSTKEKKVEKRKFHDDTWFDEFILPQIEKGNKVAAALCMYNEVLRKKFKGELPERFKFYKDFVKNDGTLDYSKIMAEEKQALQSDNDRNSGERETADDTPSLQSTPMKDRSNNRRVGNTSSTTTTDHQESASNVSNTTEQTNRQPTPLEFEQN